VSFAFQSLPEVAIVVDFAIKDDFKPADGVGHWLTRRRGKIYYREPSVTERYATIR
jgi:hypothetical protein